MDRWESHHHRTRRAGALTMIIAVAAFAAVATGAFDVRGVGAYDQWSTSRTTGNCATCHGDFRASGYVSKNDGVAWSGGLSLHNGHRSTMLNSDCNTCHTASRFPVALNSSDGGTGFSPISCLGCHGRAEPSAGGAVSGTGLRQHHTKTAAATCDGAGCHADSDPTAVTAAAESVQPPYYFTPDTNHPNKPTDACNGNGSESLLAPPLGLDNDGDNVYDLTDCSSTSVPPAGASPLALEGAWPNPARRSLRVAFTLSVSQPATLEAFDVNGRRVAVHQVGSMGIGRHVVELTPTRPLVPGIYLLKLTQGGRVMTSKATVAR